MGSDIVGTMSSSYGLLALLFLLLVLGLWRSGFFRRLLRVIEEMMFSNWQLALLGATAIALSLASGYTTFDGLRNFTSAPLLSVLIAFGIQGVMLIVAWLIGESFATGMNQQIRRGKGLSAREAVIGMGLGVALVGLVFYWLLSRYDAVGFSGAAGAVEGFRTDWQRFADVALYFTMALALLGLVLFGFRRGSDISVPYVQSVRLIAKNAVLWVMFLASMAASVFFSFDSHFNAIFPADQRKRAAEIRTLNQVGGIVADIGERAQKVQIAEAERLFDTDGWKAYDAQLSSLAAVARGSQAEIEAYFVQRMEERQRGIGEQQERIAGAERSQTALLRKRDELEAELQRIEPTIGALEAELAKAKTTYDETSQAIVAKRIEASAESGGVEGTGKRGRGPVYRQRMAELDELQRKLQITDGPRLKEAQRQRDLASARIVSLKRELATIVAEVAKYKGQISTARHRIESVKTREVEGGRIDPVRVLPAFERARAAFRQQPDIEKLAALQTQCGNLVAAMTSTPATKERVRSIDCDPKHAAEAAARVFALNAGLAAFQANCAGGTKLPQDASTDELLSFGRKCLQDSGLVSKESADLGARLQAIDMNRDDKAHRFVVTWNAFLDGNRLAYLAMVLAIGVDSLVFMAGLFGAAAVKSPLSDVPSPKARSAEQLEAIVRNALGEDRLENAELVLAAMRPMRGDGEHRSEVELTHYDADTARRIRKVLVAGASIGAVERAPADAHDERYLVRSELFEYLSVVANSARESDREYANRSRLEQIVGVALEPDRQTNAEIVLRHVEPINPRGGLMARVDLGSVPDDERRLVQNVLNAGMTVSAVQRHDPASGLRPLARFTRGTRPAEPVYLVSSGLFKTLLQYRAGAPSALRADTRVIELTSMAASEPKAIAAPASDDTRPRSNGHNGRMGNGAADDAGEELIWQLREELRKTLGLPASEAMMQVAADFKRQIGAYRGLVLAGLKRESEVALNEAARALKEEYAGNEQAHRHIDQIRQEIGHVVPALKLLLEPGRFDELIREVEGSGDAEMAAQLRKLRNSVTQKIGQLNGVTH